MPLKIEDEVIGVINVANSEEKPPFNQDDIWLTRLFADQAAIAIEKARLYEQISRDARIKTTLLQEVNHRVKNNLTGIIGMLYIAQSHTEQAGQPKSCSVLLEDLIRRIEGLATVHNMLSAAEWSPLALSALAEQIISAASAMQSPGQVVDLTIQTMVPVYVTPSQASTLAMVFSELTTNTIKYALTNRQSTHIIVTISEDGEMVRLVFKDDGPGFPQTVLEHEAPSLGLYLVEMLVQSTLHGRLCRENDAGAVTIIDFPRSVNQSIDTVS